MSSPLIQRFDALLAPYAVHNDGDSRRQFAEAEHPDKLPYQRDRDRVIHSKAFRRLKHKTQVWVAGKNDHFRDRLTHSIEGSQIVRGLCRSLQLNEELAETGVLAHDLGHPPFGHEGEHALDEMLRPLGFGFDHNQHSLRIVTTLENSYPDFAGLNLCAATLACLKKHETPWEMEGAAMPHEASLEAQLVNLADEISYNAHDVDDGLRSGLIELDALNKLAMGQAVQALLAERYPKLTPEHPAYQAQYVRSLVHILISDVVEQTRSNISRHNIKTLTDVYAKDKPIAEYSPSTGAALDALRQYLFADFYQHPSVRQYTDEGRRLIQELFTRFYEHPELLPPHRQTLIDHPDPKAIVIKDYIAGMTDTFAQKTVLALRARLF